VDQTALFFRKKAANRVSKKSATPAKGRKECSKKHLHNPKSGPKKPSRGALSASRDGVSSGFAPGGGGWGPSTAKPSSFSSRGSPSAGRLEIETFSNLASQKTQTKEKSSHGVNREQGVPLSRRSFTEKRSTWGRRPSNGRIRTQDQVYQQDNLCKEGNASVPVQKSLCRGKWILGDVRRELEKPRWGGGGPRPSVKETESLYGRDGR